MLSRTSGSGLESRLPTPVEQLPVAPHAQVELLEHQVAHRQFDRARRVRDVVDRVRRERPAEVVQLVAHDGSAVELVAPLEAVEAVDRLQRELVHPAQQLGVHVVALAQRVRRLGHLGRAQVLVQLRDECPLATKARLERPHQRGHARRGQHVGDRYGPVPRGAAIDEQSRRVRQQSAGHRAQQPDPRDAEVQAHPPPEHQCDAHQRPGQHEQQRVRGVQEPGAGEDERQPGGPSGGAAEHDEQRADELHDGDARQHAQHQESGSRGPFVAARSEAAGSPSAVRRRAGGQRCRSCVHLRVRTAERGIGRRWEHGGESVRIGGQTGGDAVERDGERIVLDGRASEQRSGARVVDENQPDAGRGDQPLVVRMLGTARRCAQRGARSAGQSSSPIHPIARASAVDAARSHAGAEPAGHPRGVQYQAARWPRCSPNSRRSDVTHRSAEPPQWCRAIAASVPSSGRTHVGSLHGTPSNGARAASPTKRRIARACVVGLTPASRQCARGRARDRCGTSRRRTGTGPTSRHVALAARSRGSVAMTAASSVSPASATTAAVRERSAGRRRWTEPETARRCGRGDGPGATVPGMRPTTVRRPGDQSCGQQDQWELV